MTKRLFVLAVLVLSSLACLVAASIIVATLLRRAQGESPVVDETMDEDIANTTEGLARDERDYGGEYTVTNPTSGSAWYVRVLQYGDATTAIVLVPGGRGTSRDFLSERRGTTDLVDAGYTVVLFDPEGRGNSDGVEDDNGTIDQDGLKAVVDFAGTLPGITDVGIASFSYGITMASGMLARYPGAAAFLTDWEGPADREETGGCDADDTGHLREVAECDDEEFWAQREALTFIGDVGVPYMRIQTVRDHAQPNYAHAVKMVNAARAGGVATFLNGEEVTMTLTDASITPFLMAETEERALMHLIAAYVEMR